MADTTTTAVPATATLTVAEKTLQLPILKPTVGPDVIDIRKLYGQGDVFTFDPGFTSTASCQSAITFIDGDEGILLHRGYPIDQLAEKSTFMEVAYLLLHGDLPSGDELSEFTYTISRHTMLHEQLMTFYRGFRRDAHPMAIMCGVVGALSAFYHDSTDITDPTQRLIASHRLIAKMPTIAAMAYDEALAERIRELLGDETGVTEQKMFGGLAFLIGGNMAVAASGQGGALVRVDAERSDAIMASSNARPMEMRGRPMTGWLLVAADAVADDAPLQVWVDRGVAHVRTLPPKET